MATLTTEELLAGAGLTHEVMVPVELLPSNGHTPDGTNVVIQPVNRQRPTR